MDDDGPLRAEEERPCPQPAEEGVAVRSLEDLVEGVPGRGPTTPTARARRWTSWLPRTASTRSPASAAHRRTSRERGPRLTRSPTRTMRSPRGGPPMRARSRRSVSKHPCTSPIAQVAMSRGVYGPARTLYRPVSVTLRLKLFVLIGGLLALMVGAEWLLIETLTKDLRVEVSAVATSVGKDIVRILHPGDEKAARGSPLRLPASERIVIHDEAHVVALPHATVERRGRDGRGTGGARARRTANRRSGFVVTTVQTTGDGTPSRRRRAGRRPAGPDSSSSRGPSPGRGSPFRKPA